MESQRETEFTTESIDLASFLSAAGYEPLISLAPDGTRAVFSFDGEGLYRAVISYEQGASLPAKRLLNKRSWLFREASRACREVRR